MTIRKSVPPYDYVTNIEMHVLTDNPRVATPEMLPPTGLNLLAQLLDQQQSLSAVDRFSHWQSDGGAMQVAARLATPRYRSLVPATPPGPGQQYAFEVDLDRCSGCKACVVACHTLNGLDEAEAWRDVGLLIGGSRTAPVMQHFTAACHHCLEPACMVACPVNAYEKDADTGIVKHLDDQCFGCQYCTLACPYDVPKYHPAKGIVRKCDMCSSRLAVGEPPACVQACPHEAIAIRIVSQEQVIDDSEAAAFLPGAPDPQITLPTTTYKTRRPFPRNLLPADYFRVNQQHAHWPLVIMLALTQLSVGAFVTGFILERVLKPDKTMILGATGSASVFPAKPLQPKANSSLPPFGAHVQADICPIPSDCILPTFLESTGCNLKQVGRLSSTTNTGKASGTLVENTFLERLMGSQIENSLRPLHAANALAFGMLALAASLFHLGRPRYAYRAVLGLRHSWLSREIVAFGLFAGLATAYAFTVFAWRFAAPEMAAAANGPWWIAGLGWSVAITGGGAIFCSAMVYVFTQRECWSFARVGVRFVLTAAILGIAAMWLSILMASLMTPSPLLAAVIRECGPTLCQALMAVTAFKLIWEAAIFRHLLLTRMTPLRRSAVLLTGELSTVTLARFALGVLGGVLMPAMLLAQVGSSTAELGLVQFAVTTGLLFVACLAGELLERYLFFTACAAPSMPGGIR